MMRAVVILVALALGVPASTRAQSRTTDVSEFEVAGIRVIYKPVRACRRRMILVAGLAPPREPKVRISSRWSALAGCSACPEPRALATLDPHASKS